MKRLLLILWAVFLLFPSNVSYAIDFQLRISPDSLTFGTMEPGTSRTQHITITETSDSENFSSSVNLSLSVSGSAASWVSLSSSNLMIHAGNFEGVKVTVTVPENADYGEHDFGINIQAGEYLRTVPCTLVVPNILALSPASVDVTITEEYGDNVSLEITNVCSTANISDVLFSADDSLNKWLVLPTLISSLGKGATMTTEVEVRVPAGESKPIGIYSGNIYAEYKYGPPTALSTSMTVTILPSEQWFNEKYERINNLDNKVLVYQITEPYTVNVTVTNTKDAMFNLLDLTKEDTSHFYDLTDPFLNESIVTLEELAIDLVKAFDDWQRGDKTRGVVEFFRQSINNRIAYLQNSIDKETRIEYEDPMRKIHEQLSNIISTWEEKINQAIKESHSLGDIEEALGYEDLSRARSEPLIYPSREYFISAKNHFYQAYDYYISIGSEAKAKESRNNANECETQEELRNSQMTDIVNFSEKEEQAGDSSYDKGLKTEGLTDSSNYFKQAKIHFSNAAEEYRKIGTQEYDDKARHCEERAGDSEEKKRAREQSIPEKEDTAVRQFSLGEDAIKKGEHEMLPFTAIAHYDSAKKYFEEARNLYNTIGGDTKLKKELEISKQIQEIDQKIKTEKIKLGAYISVISIIILAIIVLLTRRYLPTMSIWSKHKALEAEETTSQANIDTKNHEISTELTETEYRHGVWEIYRREWAAANREKRLELNKRMLRWQELMTNGWTASQAYRKTIEEEPGENS